MSADEDIETLLLELWRSRMQSGVIESVCEKLIAAAPSRLEEVEMYLPQFSHLIIRLADDLPTVAPIERFVLSVCQLSIHIALQFFWMVYAELQETRPKLGKERSTYKHCARLLVQLEQCVVYGGGGALAPGASPGASELMRECVRVASESQASAPPTESVVHSGLLRKQGGATSRCGRKSWNERYFEIRDRVLYYYSGHTAPAASQAPRGSMQLATAAVSVPKRFVKGEPMPNYFEVHDKQSGLKFCLEAPTSEALGKWIVALQAVTAMPEPPGMRAAEVKQHFTSILDASNSSGVTSDAANISKSVSDFYLTSGPFRELKTKSGRARQVEGVALVPEATVAEASADVPSPGGAIEAASVEVQVRRTERSAGREVYAYFNSQREFVRDLTNLAEELRFMTPDERQAELQPRLDQIALPPGTYYPLANSAQPCERLLRFTPDESIVFNTKARCPIMLLCEIARQPYPIADLHKHLSEEPAATSSAAVAAAERASGEARLTVGEKKREAWDAKKGRLRSSSPLATSVDGWALKSFIVKSNDDLRQEVFIMQMIRYLETIWPKEQLWLNCYYIEATGPDTGLIETIIASSDLDRLKKSETYTSLRNLFIERHGAPGSDTFLHAQDNFVRSLAAYSIVMWLLKLRDRHNGNLMLDEEGHYFHVDFGFCLGHSTGKGIGGLVECSVFKLTEEYIDLLDGRGSPVFEKYTQACVAAMQASHAHADTILSMVEIVGTRSGFPCFGVFPISTVLPKLRQRLFAHLPASAVEAEARALVQKAAGHWGSRRYDWFQMKQRGIKP